MAEEDTTLYPGRSTLDLTQLEEQFKESVPCCNSNCAEVAIWKRTRNRCCGEVDFFCGEHKYGWDNTTGAPLHPLTSPEMKWFHVGCPVTSKSFTWAETLTIDTWERL